MSFDKKILEEISRFSEISNYKNLITEETIAAKIARGVADDIIKKSIQNSIQKAIQQATETTAQGLFNFGKKISTTDEFVKNIMNDSTFLNKIAKSLGKNQLNDAEKLIVQFRIKNTVTDDIIKQIADEKIAKISSKTGQQTGAKALPQTGTQSGGKLTVQTATDAGEKALVQITPDTSNRLIRVIDNIQPPKVGNRTTFKSLQKEIVDAVFEEIPESTSRQLVAMSKNLSNESTKKSFLSSLAKLGIIQKLQPVGKWVMKYKGTLVLVALLGGGALWVLDWLGSETEVKSDLSSEEAQSVKQFDSTLQAEKKWRLLDNKYGQQLKTALGKDPSEAFTDQDIDDIYKRLTDLNIIQ